MDEKETPPVSSSQSEQIEADPEIHDETFFLYTQIEHQNRAILRLEIDAKRYQKELSKYRTRKARYERLLQSTVLAAYDSVVHFYQRCKFHRCQDCYKRKFRARLYKEPESHQRIYLCPTCLISANQLPNLKFVPINLSR